MYRVIKLSVQLTITVQSQGGQIFFDHPVLSFTLTEFFNSSFPLMGYNWDIIADMRAVQLN